jgi:hypothetical protein
MSYQRSLLVVDDIKGVLHKDTLTTKETKLLEDELIPGVSAAIEKYLNRKILSPSTALTEYYNGDNSPVLQLREWPILSVTSVDDKRNNPTGWEPADYDFSIVENTDFIQIADRGQLRYVNGWWIDSPPYFYKVIYKAGYAIANIPPDLLLGVKKWIAVLFQKTVNKLHGVEQHIVGDEVFNYDLSTIPKEIIGLIKPYRRLYG